MINTAQTSKGLEGKKKDRTELAAVPLCFARARQVDFGLKSCEPIRTTLQETVRIRKRYVVR